KVNVTLHTGNDSFLEQASEIIVKSKSNYLTVKMETPGTGNNEYLPSRQAAVDLEVTDWQGKGVKAKVFAYAVDNGNLSLTNYRVPDLQEIYSHTSLGMVERMFSWNVFSKDKRKRWLISHPDLDIDISRADLFGRIVRPDGTPIAGVRVIRYDAYLAFEKEIARAVTSANGYYCFNRISGPRIIPDFPVLKIEKEGYVTYLYMCGVPLMSGELSFFLKPLEKGKSFAVETVDDPLWSEEIGDFGFDEGIEGGVEGGVVGGVLGGILGEARPGKKTPAFRLNRRPVLFFRHIETDENGSAQISFNTSDRLSTFKIMAVAYSARAYGKAVKDITVTTPLMVREAMPEYALEGDRFTAGTAVGNRKNHPVSALVSVDTGDSPLAVTGKNSTQITIEKNLMPVVPFQFKAEGVGEAQLRFSAVSQNHTDGVIHSMPVFSSLVSDRQLWMAYAKSLKRNISLSKDLIQPVLKIAASFSANVATGKMFNILLKYPYGCMEQRTSRVFPMLLLDDDLHMRVNLTEKEIAGAVKKYLSGARSFMTPNGAMAYYKNSPWHSDHLTVYVLHTFQLAKAKGYRVDRDIESRMISYLNTAGLSSDIQCYYQYVLCRPAALKKASPADMPYKPDALKLNRLYKQRDSLSLLGRVYLYKALHHAFKDREKTRLMFEDFKLLLTVEKYRTFFDVPQKKVGTDLPFYGRRYINALILQAILEVEGGYRHAAAVLRYLLNGRRYGWRTTQINLRILQVLKRMKEAGRLEYVDIRINGKTTRKVFKAGESDFRFETPLTANGKDIRVEVVAHKPLYITMELNYKSTNRLPVESGIHVTRNVYGETGKQVKRFVKGEVYQVEILIHGDKAVNYGVVDESLPAGFQLM
ncbi:MAG: hypothetical protein GY765_40360, partial [bacterium]|nr:hypothetical protein [bacterium]